jgi:hypothetical protein
METRKMTICVFAKREKNDNQARGSRTGSRIVISEQADWIQYLVLAFKGLDLIIQVIDDLSIEFFTQGLETIAN